MRYASLLEVGRKGLTLSKVLVDLKVCKSTRRMIAFYLGTDEVGEEINKMQYVPVSFDSPKAIKLLQQAIEAELESDRESANAALSNPDPLETFNSLQPDGEVPF